MRDIFETTICAPATGTGGAISIIRISGPDAIKVADRIFIAADRKALEDAGGYSLHFGTIYEPNSAAEGRSALDEAVVSVFRSPRSYTGEDSVEISCHASPYIVSRILELLVANGVAIAAPGEFTRRAFVNGKMDLAQAEAVADVISAQTSAAHRVALNQLKGGFSRELAQMRSSLLEIASLMELELDFSEEEVEFADRQKLRNLVESLLLRTRRMISGFSLGNAIKNGVPVAIAGATNAGKSTLLNCILGENRAIVSDVEGTTRDTVEETFNVDGVLFRFIDTAGLRNSTDTVEKLGIERSYRKISEASVILVLCDLTSDLARMLSIAKDIAGKACEGQKIIFLLNKTDAVSAADVASASDSLSVFSGCRVFPVCAMTGEGVDAVLHHIASIYADMGAGQEDSLVTNLRHVEALEAAATSLSRIIPGLDSATPTDLVAQDLREAIYHLGTITGDITTDEVLGNIFRNFCIGK